MSSTSMQPDQAPPSSQPVQPVQPVQSWKPRPAAVQLTAAYTRVYDSLQQHVPSCYENHHQAALVNPLEASVVYADVAVARGAAGVHQQCEMSPTEYAVLQFMGAGQEVQV